MPENSIAIIPPEGYPNQKNYSIKAVRWIQSEAKTRGIEIKHALNGGEQRINGHYVDGYHEESRTVFEFNGCYWHGCPTHFPDRNRVQHHQCLTMHQLYILTIGKSEELRKAGYQVVEFWECDKQDKIKFKQDYFEAEGIRLENVEKNKGMRAIAKIMLNSLWGKLAQRENMTKTEYISEPSKFFDLVTNPNKIVKNVDICRENLLLVNWDDTESSVEPHACSNVIVAAFVTAQARLKLYEPLEKLNERVLYFDTDSIIYHHKPHLWNPTIVNNRLGEWTDEVPNARIVKFVGMGPKNYGYEFIDKHGKRKSTCKVKGLTLDYNTSQVIHFDRMLNWVKGESKDFRETVNYHRIRKHKDKTVATELQSKTYRFTYTKRVIVGDGYTVPYGYLA